MEGLYWTVEFFRVAFAYMFILFVWPSVVFRKHLKTRSRTYRFAFCAVIMVVLVNTAVIGLGLLHILNNWTVRLLFWGILLVSILKSVKISEQNRKRFRNFFNGTYGYKSMLYDVRGFLHKKIKQIWNAFLDFMKGHWFEYILLAVLVLFGVIYFSTGVFHDQSYGFGDMYPHHSWIYDLSRGIIFSDGVYPEGMHCFVYCENILFGIEMYNCLLFTAGIHSSVILVSMFIFFRELFIWKYSPYLLLTLFLIVDLKCGYAVTCQSRWQWTMPQEFGFPALFLCAAYLIRFLREKSIEVLVAKENKNATGTETTAEKTAELPDLSTEKINNTENEKSDNTLGRSAKLRGFIGRTLGKLKKPLFLREDNLFIFTMSLAATLICHFYTTILAFAVCICIVLFMLKSVFSRRFIPLCVACFCGIMIAFMPMLGAFAEGIPPQGSLVWAMKIMGIPIWDDEGNLNTGDSELLEDADDGQIPENNPEDEARDNLPEEDNRSTGEKIRDFVLGFPELAAEKWNILYESGFVTLNGEERTALFLVAALISMLLWMFISLYRLIYYRIINKQENTERHRYVGYPALAAMAILFPAMYCAQAIGLPYLIEWYRVCVFAQMASLGTLIVPFDFIASKLVREKDNVYVRATVVTLVIGFYTIVRVAGIFRGYLMFELTRYNCAVNVTRSIMKDMAGNDNFTIISTTDEYYQQIEHGFHEEIINFVNESQEEGYTLPSQYLFIYVEKNVMARAQYHLFTGPDWLADKKYRDFYGNDATQCPDILRSTIREDLSTVYFGKFPLSSNVYNTHWQRTILMSKLYVWCQKFNAMYPNELRVYYEDENFVCYYLIQNPRNLYDLSVFDQKVMVPPEDYKDPIWPEDAFAKEAEAVEG